MPQDAFKFSFSSGFVEDDFVLSSSNSNAYKLVKKWPHWNSHAILIYGPQGSGKSHLAKIWQSRTEAVFLNAHDVYKHSAVIAKSENKRFILDDVERIHDEVSLFHMFNSIKEISGSLLVTASRHPSNLQIRLPDIKSRLCAIPSAGVNNPDDELLRQILFKQFTDRQLKVPLEVIDYLISRMERSFPALYRTVEALDKNAMLEKKSITVPFARKILSGLKSS